MSKILPLIEAWTQIKPPEFGLNQRGCRKTCLDQMLPKTLVIMIVRQVHTPSGLLTALCVAQATQEMKELRRKLSLADGRFPCRHTWERRLASIPDTFKTLVAEVAPTNVIDNEQAPTLTEVLPPDSHFPQVISIAHDQILSQQCDQRGCTLVTSFTGRNNPYPHYDDGVEVRRILRKARLIAIENFNGYFA